MITTLPIALPARADEPGFSVLARNTHSNASRTTFEFCSAVGLSKPDVCAGKPSALVPLSRLTGSCSVSLFANSPQQENRRLTSLGSKKLLTRSLRKAEQLICPACWQEDLQRSRSHLHIRKQWLPTTIHSCLKHSLTLIPLPLIDYTSCYDHIIRAGHVPGWIERLGETRRPLNPTAHERAAIKSLDTDHSICPWLGEPQLDAMADWSLGLGMLIHNRKVRPQKLTAEERRKLTEVDFEVGVQGRAALDAEIDAALVRYKRRMSDTWLMTWVTQSAKPPERRIFRKLMLEISGNQGQYCLTNVSWVAGDQHLVDCEIVDIAKTTKRSKAWVRRALQNEGLLPASGVPETSNLKMHMKRCRRYILAIAESLDATKSAERINIGIKGFETLVEGYIIPTVKSKSHKRPRFSPAALNELLTRLEQHTIECDAVESPEFCSVADACFIYQVTTAEIVRLLFGGLLPSSKRMATIPGYLGVRLKRDELLNSKKVLTEEQLNAREVCRLLEISADQLHTLRELQLLPCFTNIPGRGFRSNKSVGKSVLDNFLKRYQTVSTAAKELEIDPSQLRSQIADAGIRPAKECAGVPIFYRSDLLG